MVATGNAARAYPVPKSSMAMRTPSLLSALSRPNRGLGVAHQDGLGNFQHQRGWGRTAGEGILHVGDEAARFELARGDVHRNSQR